MEKHVRFQRLIFEQQIGLSSKRAAAISALFFSRVTLNFLDLFGVLVVSYLIGGLSADNFPSIPDFLTKLLPTGPFTQEAAVNLGILAAAFFILKAGLAMTTIFASTRLSAQLEADYASNGLGQKLKHQHFTDKPKGTEDLQLEFSRGARARISGLLNAKLDIAGESGLFFVLSLSLLIVSPIMGLSIVLFLTASLWLMLHLILRRARRQQLEVQRTEGQTLYTLRKVTELFTELRLSSPRVQDVWLKRIWLARRHSGLAFSNLRLLQSAPRYAIEILAIVGVFGLAAAVISISSMEEQGAQLGFALASLFRLGSALVPLQTAVQLLTVARVDSKLASNQPNFPESMIKCDLLDQPLDSEKPVVKAGTNFQIAGGKELRVADDFYLSGAKWTAIFGPSGIGKTSFLNSLIAYLVKQGLAPSSIGYCPQSPSHLDDDLQENILLYPSATDEEIERAKRLADSLGLSHDTAINPKNYDSDQTGGFSGGQMLRLGIARALVKNPQVLILDEPTSSLDSATADKTLDWISEHFSGFVLLVSHDVSALMRAGFFYQIRDNGRELALLRASRETAKGLGIG